MYKMVLAEAILREDGAYRVYQLYINRETGARLRASGTGSTFAAAYEVATQNAAIAAGSADLELALPGVPKPVS